MTIALRFVLIGNVYPECRDDDLKPKLNCRFFFSGPIPEWFLSETISVEEVPASSSIQYSQSADERILFDSDLSANLIIERRQMDNVHQRVYFHRNRFRQAERTFHQSNFYQVRNIGEPCRQKMGGYRRLPRLVFWVGSHLLSCRWTWSPFCLRCSAISLSNLRRFRQRERCRASNLCQVFFL